jgi:hypothetical protein
MTHTGKVSANKELRHLETETVFGKTCDKLGENFKKQNKQTKNHIRRPTTIFHNPKQDKIRLPNRNKRRNECIRRNRST